jgi:LuxR family maltose regulon positive regulatory protein
LTAPVERFSAPLIKTKLSAPQLRADLVARPQLLVRLNESVLSSFTLVCAPAGYGKTTLLINWIANLKKTSKPAAPIVCWVSLDEGDNEPIRFLSYLTSAFETSGTGIGAEPRKMLQSNPSPPLQTILAVLINDLEKLAISIHLVLDDYQFISNKDIHESMAFFLDHIPANVHLIIATRSDPPIPLARLRARGQLNEIRADGLRFSYEEADCFFNQTMGLGLTPGEMTSLEERTEGWITGLQMAALALKSIPHIKHSDISLFVKNFSGSNRYVLDFLVEEILNHQPQEIQDFLLQTSILENLCGVLCDAVTNIRSWESKGQVHSSQHILEYLERSNLFLVSLDTDRHWYRYHHLFADLLHARLEQRAPEMVPELHKRASKWYEQNQRIPEAIDHALDAREYEQACRLIDALTGKILLRQSLGALLAWIKRLPAEIALSRPWLCITQAYSAVFTNEVEKIEHLLEAAEKSIHPEDRPELIKDWKGNIACLRAFVADNHNDVGHTIDKAEQALEYLRSDDSAARTFAKYMLGRAYFISGDFSQAEATLAENVHECIESNSTNSIATSLSLLSIIYRIKGKLRESVELLDQGLANIEKFDARRVTVGGLAFVGQAVVLQEWNDLEAAEKIIRKSLELCIPWNNPSATCRCYMVLARILQSQGKLPEAGEALHLAEESIRSRSPMPEILSDLNAVQVGYWLASGQISRTLLWSQGFGKTIKPEDGFSIPKEQDEISLARVLMAERQFEVALQNLESMDLVAETGGRTGRLIEIRKLQALALCALGKQQQALEMLQKSLALAEPEGYIRIFVDEGKPMQEMLLAYLHAFPAGLTAYARKVSAAFIMSHPMEPSKIQSTNLVKSLTIREIEILQAMAEGFSNHQIAEKFTLAEGTVKFYVHAVLEKLGVHNRTQAVLEAQKNKII